jgi:hypothetical protein
VAVTLNLGVGVAVLSAVAVEVVGRSDSNMVSVVFSIERSGGDGQIVLFVVRWKNLPSGVDVGSTDESERVEPTVNEPSAAMASISGFAGEVVEVADDSALIRTVVTIEGDDNTRVGE